MLRIKQIVCIAKCMHLTSLEFSLKFRFGMAENNTDMTK